jgi:hypothetical protein
VGCADVGRRLFGGAMQGGFEKRASGCAGAGFGDRTWASVEIGDEGEPGGLNRLEGSESGMDAGEAEFVGAGRESS